MDNRPVADLRNLGPACARDLHAVGIFTADDIRKLGVEGTFSCVIENRMASGTNGNSISANYLYALYGALHDCDWRDIPQQKTVEFQQLAARLRKQYLPQKTRA